MKQAVYDTATPYIASYIIFRKDGKVAFVLRSNTDWMNNYYGLPSGKVEKDETFTGAAIREAKEEVGVDVRAEDLKPLLTVHRHSDDSEWVDLYMEATKWSGELYNAEPHMHSELAWLDPDDLPENTIPSVAFSLAQIKAGKTYAEHSAERNQ